MKAGARIETYPHLVQEFLCLKKTLSGGYFTAERAEVFHGHTNVNFIIPPHQMWQLAAYSGE